MTKQEREDEGVQPQRLVGVRQRRPVIQQTPSHQTAGALEAAKLEVGAVHAAVLDIADPQAVAAAAEASHSALGRIDVLVVSAGVTGATATAWEYPIESWKRVIDVDLNGPFYCCRAIAPFMLRADLAHPGTRIDIDIFGERFMATVHDGALWDPQNQRLRG